MTMKYAPKQTISSGHTVQINNIEMYYEEYGAGKSLVLLHGFGGCVQKRAIMRRASFETIPREVNEMYRECAKHSDEQIRQHCPD